MLLSNIELLNHIIDEIIFIEATKDKGKSEAIDDPILSGAIIRSLEIIGEACRKVNPD